MRLVGSEGFEVVEDWMECAVGVRLKNPELSQAIRVYRRDARARDTLASPLYPP